MKTKFVLTFVLGTLLMSTSIKAEEAKNETKPQPSRGPALAVEETSLSKRDLERIRELKQKVHKILLTRQM